MNTNEIIETLTAYNAWRRGDDSQPVQEPKNLGEATHATTAERQPR